MMLRFKFTLVNLIRSFLIELYQGVGNLVPYNL